ncbi:hypothetical protein VT03_25455 [Planctomyces sp. SH-PL14]|nr:hypothetical protein VT03_25455 [Planctomyces sp. SH-PL14]
MIWTVRVVAGREGAFVDWSLPNTDQPGPGAPWWGVQRGNAPLPAGGLAVERCLKE